MIKVLHLIKSLGRGGAETLLSETIRLHDSNKYQFFVAYFLPWKDQMVQAIEEEGGNVYCLDKKNNWEILRSAKDIWHYCTENQIDLIHAHLPWAGIVARRVYKKYGIPVVYTEHNKQERYHFLTKWMNHKTFDSQSMAIAVSKDVQLSIEKNIRPSIPIKTILNGVNTSKYDCNNYDKIHIRKVNNIPNDSVVLGTVAVFRTQKRLVKWVEVASFIKQRLPSAFFIMLGDGPEEDKIKEEVNYRKIKDSIIFPGRLEDVRPWLSIMDIYMMTSEFEGLPIALLEAMSMELPVISTDAGGIKEVIRDGNEGYLVSVNAPNDLIEPAIKLAFDPDKRIGIGKRGRERILDGFSLEKMVNELETVYSKILELTSTIKY